MVNSAAVVFLLENSGVDLVSIQLYSRRSGPNDGLEAGILPRCCTPCGERKCYVAEDVRARRKSKYETKI